MKFPKRIVALLVTAFLVGSATLLIKDAAAVSSPIPSVQVPVGKIGDSVRYETLFQGKYNTFWRSPSTHVLRNFTGHTEFEVSGVSQSIDDTGRSRPALLIRYNRVEEAPVFSRNSGLEYVDLATRDILLLKDRYEVADLSFVASIFGPQSERLLALSQADLLYHQHIFQNDSYEFQGRTLRLGEDTTASDMGPLLSGRLRADEPPQGFAVRASVVEATEASFHSLVDRVGERDGHAVLGITRQFVLRYTENRTRGDAWNYEEHMRWTTWLSHLSPYPVRIEREGTWTAWKTATRDLWASVEYRYTEDLVSHSSGSEPIPWSRPSGPHDSARAGLERSSTDAHYPADGRGGRFPYALSTAVERVKSDPTLDLFQTWLRQHPEHYLVGVKGGIGKPRAWTLPPVDEVKDSNFRHWLLIFAAPGPSGASNQAFVVESTMYLPGRLVTNEERGALQLTPNAGFERTDLPVQPLTLSAIDLEWRRHAPANATRAEPAWVSWGYFLSAGPGGAMVAGSKFHLHLGGIGNFGYPDPVPAIKAPNLFWRADFDWLYLNVSSGRPYHAGWVEFWDAYDPPNPGGVTAVLPVEGQRHYPFRWESAEAVDPIAAGTFATSVIALILLAVYPLLKYFPSQGFSGYAKLRKSDLLTNPFRDQLLQLVKSEPGISPPELHGRIGGGWSTVNYHLSVLEKNKLVSSLIDGRHKRLFPTEKVNWSERGAIAALRNDRTRTLYGYIQEVPGTLQAHLARRLGISLAATQWHLERLQRAALITSERRGTRVHYYARDPSIPVTGDAAG